MKIKEAAEIKYPGKEKKAGSHGVIVRECRKAFIAGVTSEAAREYWEGQGWVSVGDGEVPYNGQNIICYYNPSDKYKKPYVITLWWSRGKWYYDAEEYNPAEDETLKVTHYRPLPAPPNQ